MAAGPDAFLAAMTSLSESHAKTQPPRTKPLWRHALGWLFTPRPNRRDVARLPDHLLRDIGASRANVHDLFDRRDDLRF